VTPRGENADCEKGGKISQLITRHRACQGTESSIKRKKTVFYAQKREIKTSLFSNQTKGSLRIQKKIESLSKESGMRPFLGWHGNH